MRIAQIQGKVYTEVERNLAVLEQRLADLDGQNIDLVCVGEMFTCPYRTDLFPVYAEPEGGSTWQRLSAMARAHHIYLSAGTVPERDAEGCIYNTGYVFDREGRQIAKHRKAHLFDIDVKGGQYFKESATLTAGDAITVFDTEFGKLGLCICFDCRFPEIVRQMVLRGAWAVLCPAAFNRTTGPAHWELMFRSRALDNQCYMIGTSDAADETASYISYGHSIVTDPWGYVAAQMEDKEGVQIVDLDPAYVEDIRAQLPFLSARRTDLYD